LLKKKKRDTRRRGGNKMERGKGGFPMQQWKVPNHEKGKNGRLAFAGMEKEKKRGKRTEENEPEKKLKR